MPPKAIYILFNRLKVLNRPGEAPDGVLLVYKIFVYDAGQAPAVLFGAVALPKKKRFVIAKYIDFIIVFLQYGT
jgi:hypothetical protein